eukprot:10974227-Lingulodinium_polyedra.AAC.1
MLSPTAGINAAARLPTMLAAARPWPRSPHASSMQGTAAVPGEGRATPGRPNGFGAASPQ